MLREGHSDWLGIFKAAIATLPSCSPNTAPFVFWSLKPNEQPERANLVEEMRVREVRWLPVVLE